MSSVRRFILVSSLALLGHGGVPAAVPEKYQVQPILRLGDPIGDTGLQAFLGFEVGALNDSGHLLFVTYLPGGSPSRSDLLFQYAGGKFAPVVRPGEPSPLGTWPNSGINSPVSMNQSGNAAFLVRRIPQGNWIGDFLWDAKTRQVTAIAVEGMPAVNDLILTFRQAILIKPAINNRDEVTFAAEVRDANRKVLGVGVFFRDKDGKLQAVALPQQHEPDGTPIHSAASVSLNDTGRIAFLAVRQGDTGHSAYLWEKGELTPIAKANTRAPGGERIVAVLGAWVNNKNRNVLVGALLDDLEEGPLALYHWSEGKLLPVAVPGQEMPDGGTLTRVAATTSVSFANDAGQHAFAALVNGETAAYLMDVDRQLSPILRSGTATGIGTIRNVGVWADSASFGIGLNYKGQIALTVQIDGDEDTLVLLTPVPR
jgi:hypothetical protein